MAGVMPIQFPASLAQQSNAKRSVSADAAVRVSVDGGQALAEKHAPKLANAKLATSTTTDTRDTAKVFEAADGLQDSTNDDPKRKRSSHIPRKVSCL